MAGFNPAVDHPRRYSDPEPDGPPSASRGAGAATDPGRPAAAAVVGLDGVAVAVASIGSAALIITRAVVIRVNSWSPRWPWAVMDPPGLAPPAPLRWGYGRSESAAKSARDSSRWCPMPVPPGSDMLHRPDHPLVIKALQVFAGARPEPESAPQPAHP
jgi:hypothetical protein